MSKPGPTPTIEQFKACEMFIARYGGAPLRDFAEWLATREAAAELRGRIKQAREDEAAVAGATPDMDVIEAIASRRRALESTNTQHETETK
jgi:hypothetical protein